ncbi:MAG: PD40 domain-containing protein [Anaerolineae bacterium]|nr:PD40 domain-containing protein [Anaerolineae bacterium]
MAAALLIALAAAAGSARLPHVLAYEAGISPHRDIFLLDTESRVEHNVSHSAADDYAPSWNMAGGRLVYREAVNNRFGILFALDLGTFTMTSYSGTDSREDSIARAGWEAGGVSHVFTLGYGQMWLGDTGKPIEPVGYGFSPALSPDGVWVLYYADSPDDLNAEVYAYDHNAHRTLNLSQHAAHDWIPAWSPDGSQVAFVSTRDGNAEIYVVPFSCAEARRCGHAARRLTENSTADLDPAWSPDGRVIAFVRGDSSRSQIYTVELDSGIVQPVTSGDLSRRAPAWMP